MPLATLQNRSENACEFCADQIDLAPYPVGPNPDGTANTGVLLCATCTPMIDGDMDENHLRCLSSAMWSEHAPVQVLAWRMLDRLSDAAWARDLMDQIYLDDDNLAWAKSGVIRASDHKDSNGAVLENGDNVVLIKDLPVKGAGFTAKRGTAVRGISLVPDNPAHIEGRVEGQRIVILTEFVKKK
ncbi:PhnA protein [Amylibacter ulvae]|uniref:PhnA protein n=1 Tax=Paramylibacter ulvae TaxID=1651968 RepID=A0ABQ3D6S4_9RHOB|nr:alkylphosphonate utilization protein [Amylibacter ulvae]GHA60576.1 PhnA protein [Amylibacter ulvae]